MTLLQITENSTEVPYDISEEDIVLYPRFELLSLENQVCNYIMYINIYSTG